MLKFPRVLFFTKGSVATEKEVLEAQSYGSNVAFRNAAFSDDAAAPEQADAVAGAVPAKYEDYPAAADVIGDYVKKLTDASVDNENEDDAGEDAAKAEAEAAAKEAAEKEAAEAALLEELEKEEAEAAKRKAAEEEFARKAAEAKTE